MIGNNNMESRPWINAYWWMGCNYGDILTPYLVEKISGKVAVWTEVGYGVTTYLITGSSLTCSRANTILWGVGTIDTKQSIAKPMAVHAVRGPISRDQMIKSGIQCPEIYGDPAVLLPRYYKPTVEKKYRLGIVPHHLDSSKAWNDYGYEPDVLMISITDPVEKVIDNICRCEAIASSSLHGLITADAYEIPNIQVEFSDRNPGRKCKFADYWIGVGIHPYEPMDLRKKVEVNCILGNIVMRPIDPDIEGLLGSCPFLGKNP